MSSSARSSFGLVTIIAGTTTVGTAPAGTGVTNTLPPASAGAAATAGIIGEVVIPGVAPAVILVVLPLAVIPVATLAVIPVATLAVIPVVTLAVLPAAVIRAAVIRAVVIRAVVIPVEVMDIIDICLQQNIVPVL